jgi:hypothetical protein
MLQFNERVKWYGYGNVRVRFVARYQNVKVDLNECEMCANEIQSTNDLAIGIVVAQITTTRFKTINRL